MYKIRLSASRTSTVLFVDGLEDDDVVAHVVKEVEAGIEEVEEAISYVAAVVLQCDVIEVSEAGDDDDLINIGTIMNAYCASCTH